MRKGGLLFVAAAILKPAFKTLLQRWYCWPKSFILSH